jgi:hypothetical protein
MKTRILFFKIALCGLLTVLVAESAHAAAPVATVRGRLVHKNGTPAAAVTVTISTQQALRSAPAHTGTDGWYYLANITPGQDYLEIWTTPGGKPTIYRIQVTAPSTGVPQITVP